MAPNLIMANRLSSFHLSHLKYLSTTATMHKITPSNVKGSSSNEWLTRQLNDNYVKWSKIKCYRARSAFKLIEIDDKHHMLKPGQLIIECGAAPGAWTQVCTERINSIAKLSDKPKGRVIALDLQHMEPLSGAEVFSNKDITLPETHQFILELINGARADVVLSDMSPLSSGIKTLDHEISTNLVYAAFKLSLLTLRTGGTFLVKLLEGGSGKQIENDLKRFFSTVKQVKPPASRKESPEIYFLARKFTGISN